MGTNKLIIISLCTFIIVCFVGCNRIDEKVTKSNTPINESKINLEKKGNEKNEGYSLKFNIIYYVLKDEYFENNDVENPKLSQLIRQFICYDGVKNDIYPDTRIVALDKVSSVEEFREKLLFDNPNSLKLPPNTIVSVNVLNKWESQNYDDSSSYSDKSPKGLTYSKIQ